MQKINPCLCFDYQAQAAAQFYVSVFDHASILDTTYYQEGMPKPAGSVLTVRFSLDGQEFLALNAGPAFRFSPAISFIYYCNNQEQVDRMWQALTTGGAESQCGWLQDKFGVSWQIVPKEFIDKLSAGDDAASQRMLTAMMQMKKLDMAVLRRAYEHR
jgi:predicted 3-demethylubiquinone-9 3-methyltransferase (glyoxalase superfamily)